MKRLERKTGDRWLRIDPPEEERRDDDRYPSSQKRTKVFSLHLPLLKKYSIYRRRRSGRTTRVECADGWMDGRSSVNWKCCTTRAVPYGSFRRINSHPLPSISRLLAVDDRIGSMSLGQLRDGSFPLSSLYLSRSTAAAATAAAVVFSAIAFDSFPLCSALRFAIFPPHGRLASSFMCRPPNWDRRKRFEASSTSINSFNRVSSIWFALIDCLYCRLTPKGKRFHTNPLLSRKGFFPSFSRSALRLLSLGHHTHRHTHARWWDSPFHIESEKIPYKPSDRKEVFFIFFFFSRPPFFRGEGTSQRDSQMKYVIYFYMSKVLFKKKKKKFKTVKDLSFWK